MDSLVNDLPAANLHTVLAFSAAFMCSLGALKFRSLTNGGAIAATLVGGSIAAAAGWWPGVVLVSFFLSSSVLSFFQSRASTVVQQVRGKKRDAVQVLANGGIPAALAVVSAFTDSPGPWLVAMLAAIAGATSDTWGTELGRLSASPPRLVTTWKPVAAGTSGAISGLGTAGSLAGSIAIGIVAISGYVFGWNVPGLSPSVLLAIVAGAGFCGSLVDSLLGATVQARHRCPTCELATEQRVHSCGSATTLVHGWGRLNNDTVNLLAIAGAAMIGLLGSAI